MWEQALNGRPCKNNGRYIVWQCHLPGHADGTNPDSWSCHGYHDGRGFCFGCSRFFSVVDVYAQMHSGVFVEPGRRGKYDDATRRAYRSAFVALQSSGYQNPKAQSKEEYALRAFTEQERAYLTDVALSMSEDLKRDDQAITYLAGRGLFDLALFSNVGVARPSQTAHLRDLARAHGDAALFGTTGLESHRYAGTMHPMVANSVVVFQRDKRGLVTYYQARTLLEGRDKPYYCPARIGKMPINFTPHPGAPTLASEGFFKVAWAAEHGWNAWAPLGNRSNNVSTVFLAPFSDAVYMGDRTVNNSGMTGLNQIKERAELSGYGGGVYRIVPAPYTDADLWAANIGYEVAADYLRLARKVERGLIDRK